MITMMRTVVREIEIHFLTHILRSILWRGRNDANHNILLEAVCWFCSSACYGMAETEKNNLWILPE